MKENDLELVNKIKEYIFEPKNRYLCNNSQWCGLKDGYCPTYICYSLKRLFLFTDRQWLNAIRKIKNVYKEISFEDLIDEVLWEMRHKKTLRSFKEN